MADADQLMLIKSDAKEEVPAPGSALLVKLQKEPWTAAILGGTTHERLLQRDL